MDMCFIFMDGGMRKCEKREEEGPGMKEVVPILWEGVEKVKNSEDIWI